MRVTVETCRRRHDGALRCRLSLPAAELSGDGPVQAIELLLFQ